MEVEVGVSVAVRVGVLVCVAVGVLVAVGVSLAVEAGEAVGVSIGVLVGDGTPAHVPSQKPKPVAVWRQRLVPEPQLSATFAQSGPTQHPLKVAPMSAQKDAHPPQLPVVEAVQASWLAPSHMQQSSPCALGTEAMAVSAMTAEARSKTNSDHGAQELERRETFRRVLKRIRLLRLARVFVGSNSRVRGSTKVRSVRQDKLAAFRHKHDKARACEAGVLGVTRAGRRASAVHTLNIKGESYRLKEKRKAGLLEKKAHQEGAEAPVTPT